jgi:hypothetical protein
MLAALFRNAAAAAPSHRYLELYIDTRDFFLSDIILLNWDICCDLDHAQIHCSDQLTF